MNQSKAFLTSLLFAGLAMFLVYFYVDDQEKSLKAEFGSEVTVVVAAKDINEMEQIQDGMLQTITVPGKFRQPGADADKKTFEGSIATAPFRKGEQILMTKVMLKGAETGLAPQVAISRRAISIRVDETTAVNKLLKPGDRVDIISDVKYQTEKGQDGEVKTILQDVHVLAVGEMIQNNIPSAFEKDPVSGNAVVKNLRGFRGFSNVTVEVTPQEAQQLVHLMSNSAELYVTLRNPVDRVVASIPTVTVDEVLGPNSKKAEKERKKSPVVNAAPRAVAPPPPNPWMQGGGSFAN